MHLYKYEYTLLAIFYVKKMLLQILTLSMGKFIKKVIQLWNILKQVLNETNRDEAYVR